MSKTIYINLGVPAIRYFTLDYPGQVAGDKTALTGIRRRGDLFYISGFFTSVNRSTGVLFVGRLTDAGAVGTWYDLNFPSTPGRTVTKTSLYGPDVGHDIKATCHGVKGASHEIKIVGNYNISESPGAIGLLYQSNGKESSWTTIVPYIDNRVATNTIAHSTMGDLVVGNYNIAADSLSRAFIYSIPSGRYFPIVRLGAASTTAYGIWYNGKGRYTICGGHSQAGTETSVAYLVDWSIKTKRFKNWQSYFYNNDPNVRVTHFNGISRDKAGTYHLTGDAVDGVGDEHAFVTRIRRLRNGQFEPLPIWTIIDYPGSLTTSGNSIYNGTAIGVYLKPQDTSAYGYYVQLL